MKNARFLTCFLFVTAATASKLVSGGSDALLPKGSTAARGQRELQVVISTVSSELIRGGSDGLLPKGSTAAHGQRELQSGSCVVIGDLCDPGKPHYDEQDMVCANDGQPDEAYCNYAFGANACVIGCRSTSPTCDKAANNVRFILRKKNHKNTTRRCRFLWKKTEKKRKRYCMKHTKKPSSAKEKCSCVCDVYFTSV